MAVTFTVRYESDSLGIILAINPSDPIQTWESDAVVTAGVLPTVTDTLRRNFRVDLVTKLVRTSTDAEKVDYDEWKRSIQQARGDLDSLMGGNFLEFMTAITGVSKATMIRKLAVIYRGEVRLT